VSDTPTTAGRVGAAGAVLVMLATGQFVMTLDSSVMNVSIATVAEDVGTTVTGIQTAITLYTLVMASFVITGGTIGRLIGAKKAFSIGCVIYGAGSLTTALAPNLAVLLVGWSLLEGLGAALILPAIVALVASNFGRAERPKAYGLVASAGAIAVAIGPLVGGLFTTYLSWRWVFVAEVLIVIGILISSRKVTDATPAGGGRLDLAGTGLSALGLAGIVFGILRAGEWGLVAPRPDAPSLFGVSASILSILAGGTVLWIFFQWEDRVLARGGEPLLDPSILRNSQLQGGLIVFFFQFLLQAGLFFTIPLFLSVSLGLSSIETGVRILPLSVALLLAAAGIPRLFPDASPRRIVQVGIGALGAGIVVMILALEAGAGPEIVTWPMLLAGFGIGAASSQLGSVTVSSVPDERAPEVGGLQNTATNLGMSIGTALAGAVLVAALTSSFLTGISGNPDVPDELVAAAEVELTGGIPFLSDAALEEALAASDLDPATAEAILEENADARLGGLRTALAALAVLGVVALFATRRLPTEQPAAAVSTTAAAD
jgi:MFS family permease